MYFKIKHINGKKYLLGIAETAIKSVLYGGAGDPDCTHMIYNTGYVRSRNSSDSLSFRREVNILNKKYHLLIPCQNLSARPRLTIPRPVKDGFDRISKAIWEESREKIQRLRQKEGGEENYNQTDVRPYLPKGYEKDYLDIHRELQIGDLLYYKADSESNSVTELDVAELAYSAIWRRSLGNSVDYFKHFEPLGLGRRSMGVKDATLSPVEQIFGVVAKLDSPAGSGSEAEGMALKGRVVVSDALSPNPTQPLLVTLPALEKPKIPCPRLQFEGSNGRIGLKIGMYAESRDEQPVSSKSWPARAKGWKVYAPHRTVISDAQHTPDESTLRFEVPENPEQGINMDQVIPAAESFYFHVDFENLTCDELQLLRESVNPALEIDPQKLAVQLLGYGKPIGMGAVQIEIIAEGLIDRQARYQAIESRERYHDISIKVPEAFGDKADDEFKAFYRLNYPEEYRHLFESVNDQSESQDEAYRVAGDTRSEECKAAGTKRLIDETALQTLVYVSTPENYCIDTPVCAPFIQNPGNNGYNAIERFNWFKEGAQGQTLRPVRCGDEIPKLSASWRNDE